MFGGMALAISLVLATPGQARDEKNDPSPEEVLRKAGLSRSGHSYVLDGDAEAEKLAQTIERLRKEVAQGTRRKAEVDDDLAADARKAAALRKKADQLRQQADQARKTNKDRANKLEREARDLIEKARREGRPDARDKAQKKQSQDIAEERDDDREALKKAEERQRSLVQQTNQAYNRLWKRPEVRDALRALNKGRHPKFALGPVSAYSANLIRQCTEHLADLGLDRQDDLFALREDADWIARTSATYREFSQKKASGEMPNSLAEAVRDLRRDADAPEAKRKRLAKDEEVNDLIGEIGRATRSKPKVGTSPAYARSLKELESMERELGSAGPGAKP